jgi:acyl-coenzyme A thioesterase PaaI-like protein
LLPPEEGKARLLATPEPRFCSLANTVHGGWIMTMLDTVMALAAQSSLIFLKDIGRPGWKDSERRA